MTAAEVFERLQAALPGAAEELEAQLADPSIRVAPERLRDVCRFLRDDEATRMEYLRLVTGIDRLAAAGSEAAGHIEVVYHLWSYRKAR